MISCGAFLWVLDHPRHLVFIGNLGVDLLSPLLILSTNRRTHGGIFVLTQGLLCCAFLRSDLTWYVTMYLLVREKGSKHCTFQVSTRSFLLQPCISFCESVLGVNPFKGIDSSFPVSGPRKRQTRRTSLINMIMVVLTVLMYGLSTTHIALSLRQTLIAFFNQHAADGGDTILNDPGNPITYSSIAIEVVNVSFPSLSCASCMVERRFLSDIDVTSHQCLIGVSSVSEPLWIWPTPRLGLHRPLENLGTLGKGPSHHHPSSILHCRRSW